jgi:hypothetical protein
MGIAFTPKSAERIASAVRKVESSGPISGMERRRRIIAGGDGSSYAGFFTVSKRQTDTPNPFAYTVSEGCAVINRTHLLIPEKDVTLTLPSGVAEGDVVFLVADFTLSSSGIFFEDYVLIKKTEFPSSRKPFFTVIATYDVKKIDVEGTETLAPITPTQQQHGVIIGTVWGECP